MAVLGANTFGRGLESARELFFIDVVLYVVAVGLAIYGLVLRQGVRQRGGQQGFDPLGLCIGLALFIIPFIYFVVGPLAPHFFFWEDGVGASWSPGQAFSLVANVLAPIYGEFAYLPIVDVSIWLVLSVGTIVAGIALGQPPAAALSSDRPLNVLSVVAFVSVFFVSVVGIILGHIALRETRVQQQRGRGLALAALWIGYGTFAIVLIGVVLLLALPSRF